MKAAAACGTKTRYTTEAEAEKQRRYFQRIRDVDLRIYRCPLCLGWHLTKKRR